MQLINDYAEPRIRIKITFILANVDIIFLLHNLNVTNHHRDKKWTNRLTNSETGELHITARSVCPVKLNGISNDGLAMLSDQAPPT